MGACIRGATRDMPNLEYIQKSWSGGLNQRVDATRIQPNEYPLLINGRNRYDVIETIKLPNMEATLPMGNLQGIYAASNLALAFVDGKAYYRNYGVANSAFIQVQFFQLDPITKTIWAVLVPASTLNFQRIPQTTFVNGAVNLSNPVGGSPSALVAGDGISQPWVVTADGKARATQTYAQWTVNNREYVPIGRQMLFENGILYMAAKDGKSLYRSVSGRPLDFMVNVTSPAGDKPAPTEADGGAQTSAIAVAYDEITCLASLNSPDNAVFCGTALQSFKIVPDFTNLVWGEPQYDNITLFATGPLNQFCFGEILGDNTFIDFTGIRSFNAALQFRNEGKNSPFSAKVFRLFKEVLQINPAQGKFDNFALYSVKTIYGDGILLYDEISQSFVGLDIYPGVGEILQFSEIKTATFRKLLFRTANHVYEAFGLATTARLQIYVGEWCSNDPKIDQTGSVVKVVITDAKTAGTLTVTPYVDRQKQTVLTTPIKAVIPNNPLPLAVPFGVSTADTVQTFTFDIGRVASGWKIGFLLELDCEATISHVSLTAEREDAVVGPTEEARNYGRLR